MSQQNAGTSPRSSTPARHFSVGVARAFGGALLFSLPLLMTMEMWWLGFSMSALRLALLLLLTFPVLVGLSHYIGFEETFGWQDDVIDAFVAYAVGFVAALLILPLLGVIEGGMSWNEIIGKVAVQAVPGSMGALLAQSQLANSQRDEDEKDKAQKQTGYFGDLFIMAVGALFLAFNVAPTEEMILISYKISPPIAIVLMIVSLFLMHGFTHALQSQQAELTMKDAPHWSVFLRFTVVAYALALLMSGFMLWIFGRTDDTSFASAMMMMVVLGFPAAIGAAAARLVL